MSPIDNRAAEHVARKRDSLKFGYLHPDLSAVPELVPLHTEQSNDLDPILYEIIRSKLANINIDHGETIRRTSGSFPVAEGNDYNASITTELGEGTAFGAHNWFFAGYADLAIRWILEFRSANPGIFPGDVFIHNDPWVGTNHQNDAAVMAPVFWDGKLFAWIYNSAHHQDNGGPIPGSINPLATSVFEESNCLSPIKIVERGVVRDDVFEAWTRRSRSAVTSALEVKAQLTGAALARERLLDVIRRYGAQNVKRAMYKTIEDTSQIVAGRLSRLPDGVWRDEREIATCGQGGAAVYKLCIQFEKRGDRLRISNRGASPAGEVVNFTVGAFRGCVLNGLFHVLGFDIDLCGAGLLRQLDFDLEQGLVNSAIFPSPVSSSIGTMATVAQSFCLGSKMISGSDELAAHATGSNALHTMAAAYSLSGSDRFGRVFRDTILDAIAGGSGGYSNRDAIDHAGPATGINHPIPDVELVERRVPILCLFRREMPSSGGIGRFRGSPAIISALIAHGSQDLSGIGSGVSARVSLGLGLDGAPPASAGGAFLSAGATCRQWLEGGRVPSSLDDLAEIAPPFEGAPPTRVPINADTVILVMSNAGAGFGDPLKRDPKKVAADVASGRMSAEDASKHYGVVLRPDLSCDEAATSALRLRAAEERLRGGRPPRSPCMGKSATMDSPQTAILASVGVDDAHVFCRHCGQHLGGRHDNYRYGCVEYDARPRDIIPMYDYYTDFAHGEQIVRLYICPSCATSIDSDCLFEDEEPHLSAGILRT